MGSNLSWRAFAKNSVFARDIPKNLRARTRLTSERGHLVTQDTGETRTTPLGDLRENQATVARPPNRQPGAKLTRERRDSSPGETHFGDPGATAPQIARIFGAKGRRAKGDAVWDPRGTQAIARQRRRILGTQGNPCDHRATRPRNDEI